MLDVSWPLARALLFRLDAERAHGLTLRAAAVAPRLLGALGPGLPAPSLQREVAGIRFAGPVGLAAGLDKDGVAVEGLSRLGFGSVEVGTVTPDPQPGNPKPRMFRYPAERAVVNRLGFPNAGSLALQERLRRLRDRGALPVPVGVNVGKGKDTPLEQAAGDYETSIRRLVGLADWFTVNVSSPNTAGLRSLQGKEALEALLPRAVAAAAGTPVFLKLAPDLDDEALGAAVGLARSHGIGAIVATNTTIRRDTFDPGEAGGLSGRPLWPVARERIAAVVREAGGLPVIGVGGIASAEQVRELLGLGCVAIQLYTALVFDGPGLVGRINRALAEGP